MRALAVLIAVAAQDAAVDTLNGETAEVVPCSCDCCQTQERLPSEQTPTLTFKCGAAAPDQQTDTCPASCEPSSADTVLTSAEQSMDYSRYCQYKCKPSSETMGSSCIRLDALDTAKTFELDGNGDANSNIYAAATSGGTSWGDDIASSREQATQQAQAMETAQAQAAATGSIDYDLQDVIENRLRAETASAMARATAAEARAKADLAAADRAAEEAQKAENVQVYSTAGNEAAVEAEAAQQAAVRAAGEAERNLRAIEAESQTVASEAAKDAVEEIKKQAAAPAKELAEAHAKMWGWDKPKFWPKVEAVRAANPYQGQMTVAVQRMDEYQGFAKGEIGKAKGDQAKAIGLATQANAMEAQGDKMGAVTLRHEIDGLLASAKGHQAKAKSDYATANTMRDSIPQWQDAAMKAATYASWKYSNVFTPPPSGGAWEPFGGWALLQTGNRLGSPSGNPVTAPPPLPPSFLQK